MQPRPPAVQEMRTTPGFSPISFLICAGTNLATSYPGWTRRPVCPKGIALRPIGRRCIRFSMHRRLPTLLRRLVTDDDAPNDLRCRSQGNKTRRGGPPRTVLKAYGNPESTAGSLAERDWEDVRIVLAGEREAYDRLVGRYHKRMTFHMARFSRDHSVLEDLVQEVFIEAYLSLPSFKNSGPFLHWLHRIATRVGYRHWARRDRERLAKKAFAAQYNDLFPAPSLESRSERAELVGALLGALLADDRRVLTLKYSDGCSAGEIAERTGWSPGLVRVKSYRVRKRLRALYEAGIASSG